MCCHCLTWTQQERSTCPRCPFLWWSMANWHPIQHNFLYSNHLHWFWNWHSCPKAAFFFLKAFSSYLIHNIRHIALMQNGLSTVSLCLLSQLLSIHLADLDIVASHPHLIKDPHSSLFNTGDCIGIFSSELVTSQDMSRSKKGICYPFCMWNFKTSTVS